MCGRNVSDYRVSQLVQSYNQVHVPAFNINIYIYIHIRLINAKNMERIKQTAKCFGPLHIIAISTTVICRSFGIKECHNPKFGIFELMV